MIRKRIKIVMVIWKHVPSYSKCMKMASSEVWPPFIKQAAEKFLYHNLTVHRAWKYSEDITLEQNIKSNRLCTGYATKANFLPPFKSWLLDKYEEERVGMSG